MSNTNYFYGGEAGQFSFFRIPRALMKDARFHGLSTDAKLLYGLMLDRMGLSLQSGWLDAENRVFIYFTLDEIQDTLVCGHNKAVRLLAELEKYTLIERVKQGQGKPAKIYVKNFVSPDDDAEEAAPEDTPLSEVKTCENPSSVLPLLKPLECPKEEGIYIDKNYTEFSYINLSINQREKSPVSEQAGQTPPCCQSISPDWQITPDCQKNTQPPHSGAKGGAVRASMSSVKQTTLVGGKSPKPLRGITACSKRCGKMAMHSPPHSRPVRMKSHHETQI